jgi:hypothetical protein
MSSKFTVIDETALGAIPEKQGKNHPQRAAGPSVNFADSDIKSVRAAISLLYNGFIMTKTQSQDGWGIYKALIDSMTGSNTTKYICAIVPNDKFTPLGSQVPLAALPWLSFQARTTKDHRVEFAGMPLKEQTYGITRNTILFDKIKLASEFPDKWVYVPDHLPLSVTIILSKEDESFAAEGTVVSALELFQTIINLEVQ